MKIEITRKINIIASAVLLSLLVIVFGAVEADAAMYSDYFVTDAGKQAISFTGWVGAGTPQACDAYDAVFYDGQCVKSGVNNDGVVLGVQNEPQVSVDLIDTRCVAEDGVAEFSFENVDHFELTGPDSDSGDGPDAKIFTGLGDGHYTLNVSNGNSNESTSFTVDCDPRVPTKPQVSARCSVSPQQPVVGQSVEWQATATGGDGNYKYQWSGDVYSSQANTSLTYHQSGKKEGYITVYSDGKKDVARCSIKVDSKNSDSEDPGDSDDGDNESKNDNEGEGKSNDYDDNANNGSDGVDNKAEIPSFSRTIEEF